MIPLTLLSMLLGASAPAAAPETLDRLVREYFLAKGRSAQRRIRRDIVRLDGLTPEALAEAIRGAQLWEARPTGDYETTVPLQDTPSLEKRVWLHVPADYDPRKRWPLILAFHTAGGNPRRMLDYTLRQLGERAGEFIVAAPNWIGAEPLEGDARPSGARGLGFTSPHESVAQPRFLLDALRRRFHIDSDRVYLMGYSLGASNAWMAAVMHADAFAGVVPLANTLQIVGRTVLYDEVLDNCRYLATLFCWGARDTLDGRGNPSPTGGIAGRARKMTAVLRALGFEHLQTVEVAGAGHRDVVPPRKELFALLDRRRVHYPRRVHQAFRLPQQSAAYWVAAEGLKGEPLPGGRLRIPQRPGESATSAQRRYLVPKLGLVEATCDGRTLRLRSRRVKRIILLLSDELLDLDRPVKILKGKKPLFEGRIRRSLNVMLREAARGWDFDRLPVARVVLFDSGRVKFGYPSTKKKKRSDRGENRKRTEQDHG